MESKILQRAKEVILQEAEAVRQIADRLDESFVHAVEAILACRGKVIVTGMGKSGLVGRKLVSTFNSTGTPAMFLHPAEGLHGDIGLLQKDDLLIAISKSGNTDELERIFPIVDRLGIRMIAITGNVKSALAKRSELVLDASVPCEAGTHNLAPTSSSTAAVVLGDALAVTVQEKRGFSAEDFSLLHPGGTLGRRLTIRVRDLMHTGDDLPVVNQDMLVKDMLVVMTAKRLGHALITDSSGRLIGIFSDGDLRRQVEAGDNFLSKTAHEVMARNPKRINPDELAEKGLRLMEDYKITSLVIVDEQERPVGFIHIHDILRSKLV